MDTLPIKLNFFKRAEEFLELDKLDQQYNYMVKKLRFEASKQLPDNDTSINFPTWNIEKKLLQWTYLNHKHLGAPISVEHLKQANFQKDIHCTNEEIMFSGPQNIIDNLVMHGFANQHPKGALINSDGSLVGSLVSKLYYLKNEKIFSDFEYQKLIPFKFKKFAFYSVYFSAWLIIFDTISFLILQLFQLTGLLDDLKLLLPKMYFFWPLVIYSTLPILLLLMGLILINLPKIK